MKRDDLFWFSLGRGRSAYGCVLDGRMVGVLYQYEEDGPRWGMSPPEGTFPWYWTTVDEPRLHQALRTPPLIAGMTPEQVQANTGVAMDAAFEWLKNTAS